MHDGMSGADFSLPVCSGLSDQSFFQCPWEFCFQCIEIAMFLQGSTRGLGHPWGTVGFIMDFYSCSKDSVRRSACWKSDNPDVSRVTVFSETRKHKREREGGREGGREREGEWEREREGERGREREREGGRERGGEREREGEREGERGGGEREIRERWRDGEMMLHSPPAALMKLSALMVRWLLPCSEQTRFRSLAVDWASTGRKREISLSTWQSKTGNSSHKTWVRAETTFFLSRTCSKFKAHVFLLRAARHSLHNLRGQM